MQRAVFCIVAIASLAVLNACSTETAAYHQAFRENFKKSFIVSCTASMGSAASTVKTNFCSCAEHSLEVKFTDDQLTTLALGTASAGIKG